MRAARLALLSLLAVASLAAAQVSRSVFLEDLTWTELRDRVAAGHTTILVPVGGTEQNGPHMAIGKHNVRAKVLAGKIAGGLGNAIVAPVVAYVPEGTIDPPSQHMKFPGTITVEAAVFEKTLESAARSFRLHGFRDIVLFGDHGGYRANLKRVADKLNREWSKANTRVHVPAEYYESADHAGAEDTALTLAIDPSLVRTEGLASRRFSATDGVQGDPSKATVAMGKPRMDLIVSRSVEAVRKATQR